jgi:hypothetical protein
MNGSTSATIEVDVNSMVNGVGYIPAYIEVDATKKAKRKKEKHYVQDCGISASTNKKNGKSKLDNHV